MKLKQIESILKRNKNVMIYTVGGVQWLGDGASLYPVFGMPHLTPENLLTMWDVPEQKRSTWNFQTDIPICHDLSDNTDEEYLAKRDLPPIYYNGQLLEPLGMEEGVIFINQRYLRPFDDLENGYELYIRVMRSGTPYVAVKEGYSLVGIVMPMQIISKGFIDDLEQLISLSKLALSNKCCVRDE